MRVFSKEVYSAYHLVKKYEFKYTCSQLMADQVTRDRIAALLITAQEILYKVTYNLEWLNLKLTPRQAEIIDEIRRINALVAVRQTVLKRNNSI